MRRVQLNLHCFAVETGIDQQVVEIKMLDDCLQVESVTSGRRSLGRRDKWEEHGLKA
jgi:hypothetical protein